MSAALELAQLAGISVGGVAMILAAVYGRKTIKWFAKIGTVATFGIVSLLVLGIGALLGWWNINLDTILEHAGIVWDLFADLVGMVVS